MHTHFLLQPKKTISSQQNTDWDVFRELLETHIGLKIPLQKEAELEDAVYYLTTAIQHTAWQATLSLREQHSHQDCPEFVIHKLREKRAARKKWHKSRAPRDKQIYNRIAKELKHLLHTIRNSSVQQYLINLTPTAETNYSLWKVTRKLKRPQQHIPPIRKPDNTWARTDAKKP
jgi:hypothetical protein